MSTEKANKGLSPEDLDSIGWEAIPDLTHGMGQRWWQGVQKGEYTIKECSAWEENLSIRKNGKQIFSGNVTTRKQFKKLVKKHCVFPKLEKATITFEHEDGRKFVMDITHNHETEETRVKADFGKNGAEVHNKGIHTTMWLKFMELFDDNTEG